MKVLDLQCSQHHVFEGWFGSEDDFAAQLQRGLVSCPMCADTSVTKMLSAPRLNLGAAQPVASQPAPVAASARASEGVLQNVATGVDIQALQAAWLQVARGIVAQTENVGARFAEEARKIHYGESEERSIRGQATVEEARELVEEGISVLPLPEGLEGPLQ